MSTSGTTGTPRAAMLTRDGQWGDALALALEQRLSPEDVHLATMPLYHVGGRALVLSHTLRGCTVHLHDAFDADAGRGRHRAPPDHDDPGRADDDRLAAGRARRGTSRACG